MSNTDEINGKKYLRISVSKAKTFHQCKKLFKLSYLDKMPKQTHDYHVLGTFLHFVLENFHKAYIEGATTAFNDQLTINWKQGVKEYKDVLTPEIKAEARPMLEGYLKRLTQQKADGTLENVIDVERNFKMDIEGKVLLNGMIDRIQIDPDNMVHIADYKSTKNKKYLKDDFFQLMTYCFTMMATDLDMKNIRASYILLRHGFEYITKEYTREEIMEQVPKMFLSYYDEMINETEYSANTGFLCNWCDAINQEGGSWCAEGSEYVSKNPKFVSKSDREKDMKKFGEVSW